MGSLRCVRVRRAQTSRGARSAQVVVGIGGGSTLDAGKAIAALATNDGDPLEYLEVVGSGKTLDHDPLPFIAVPTNCGNRFRSHAECRTDDSRAGASRPASAARGCCRGSRWSIRC